MGKNTGSKFVSQKSLLPQEYSVVQSAQSGVERFHELYDPNEGATELITYVFSGAAGAVCYLGEEKMPRTSTPYSDKPCLLTSRLKENGRWLIERVVNPGAKVEWDVVANDVMTEREVVRLMKGWVKSAEGLCLGHYDLEGVYKQAKLIVNDTPLPPRS